MRMRALRLRWSDPAPEDSSAPVDWRYISLIVATLFLNFSFCQNYGLVLCGFGSLPVVALIQGAGALLLMALFFIGPAMAAQAAQRRVFGLIGDSFGSGPALVLRACAIVFSALWIADLLAVPTLWAMARVPGRERSPFEIILMAIGTLLFLFSTGLTNIRTSARLALFTDKLCIAILIAAFIRTQDGWASIPAGFPTAGQPPMLEHLFYGLSHLALLVAPLALLAADFGSRIAKRREVTLTGLTGLALPLFGAMILSVAIGVATGASRLYQPSLAPTVGMALFSGVAFSATASRMLIAAITTFGAVRFGVRTLVDNASVRPSGRLRWFVLGGLIAGIAWLSMYPYSESLRKLSDIAATCLVIACGVLTADFVSGRRRVNTLRRVDWLGVAALLAGLSAPLCLPAPYGGLHNYWLPGPMLSYSVGIVVCICGRAVERTLGTGGFEEIPR